MSIKLINLSNIPARLVIGVRGVGTQLHRAHLGLLCQGGHASGALSGVIVAVVALHGPVPRPGVALLQAPPVVLLHAAACS